MDLLYLLYMVGALIVYSSLHWVTSDHDNPQFNQLPITSISERVALAICWPFIAVGGIIIVLNDKINGKE